MKWWFSAPHSTTILPNENYSIETVCIDFKISIDSGNKMPRNAPENDLLTSSSKLSLWCLVFFDNSISVVVRPSLPRSIFDA